MKAEMLSTNCNLIAHSSGYVLRTVQGPEVVASEQQCFWGRNKDLQVCRDQK